jgi:hypothetical protein
VHRQKRWARETLPSQKHITKGFEIDRCIGQLHSPRRGLCLNRERGTLAQEVVSVLGEMVLVLGPLLAEQEEKLTGAAPAH